MKIVDSHYASGYRKKAYSYSARNAATSKTGSQNPSGHILKMKRKPYKMASSSLLRKEANYILQESLDEPRTIKEMYEVAWPHIEADDQLCTAGMSKNTVRRMCARLVRLGEMTVNKSTRPHKYHAIRDAYMERIAEATRCKICRSFPKRVEEIWLQCCRGCPGRFTSAEWRAHNLVP